MPRRGYTAITISEPVYELVEGYIEEENRKEGYRKWRSISQFAETALMDFFRSRGIETVPRFKHFNVYGDHATVIDVKLDKWIDIYFKEDKAWCEYCEAFDCEHIRFLLDQEKFQRLLREKGVRIKPLSEK